MTLEEREAKLAEREEKLISLTDSLLQLMTTIQTNGGRTATRGNGGGRQKGKPVKDTKTGIVYKSHSAAGIALAGEFKLPSHSYVWYEIVRLAPSRFVDVGAEEVEEKKEEKAKVPAGK